MPVIGFLRPTRAGDAGHLVEQFARVCVNQAIRLTKLQLSCVGRTADRSDYPNLPLSWSPFRWRRSSEASRRPWQRRRLRQAFRLFS